jgi:hypothetical protein
LCGWFTRGIGVVLLLVEGVYSWVVWVYFVFVRLDNRYYLVLILVVPDIFCSGVKYVLW